MISAPDRATEGNETVLREVSNNPTVPWDDVAAPRGSIRSLEFHVGPMK
jgi:hypothetical protein